MFAIIINPMCDFSVFIIQTQISAGFNYLQAAAITLKCHAGITIQGRSSAYAVKKLIFELIEPLLVNNGHFETYVFLLVCYSVFFM